MTTLQLTHAKRMTFRLDSGIYTPVISKGGSYNFTEAEAERALGDGFTDKEGAFRSYWTKVGETAPAEVAAKPKRTRKAAA